MPDRAVSAYAALDSAALRVAALHRFSPALADGGPASVWVQHAISFYPLE